MRSEVWKSSDEKLGFKFFVEQILISMLQKFLILFVLTQKITKQFTSNDWEVAYERWHFSGANEQIYMSRAIQIGIFAASGSDLRNRHTSQARSYTCSISSRGRVRHITIAALIGT